MRPGLTVTLDESFGTMGRAPHPVYPRLSRLPSGETGAALVEFAIILPVMLVILLGIIDLGRVFYTYESLANAAREGARYCSLYPGDSSGTTARVTAELYPNLTPSSISTCPDQSSGPVTVTVQAEFSLVTPLMDDVVRGVSNNSVDGPLTLEASATMVIWK
jgi:Flp pilus assembly protein TadG